MVIAGIPDKTLERLIVHYQDRIGKELTLLQRLLMCGGAINVWTHYYLSDPTITWEERELPLNTLRLTRTNPDWNPIIEQCRSARAFRKYFETHPGVRDRALLLPEDIPVFVRSERPIVHRIRVPVTVRSVLEGMPSVLHAIAHGESSILCVVGTVPLAAPRPACEDHAVYDVIVAWRRGIIDRKTAVTMLRALVDIFANARGLLETRFGPRWEPDSQDVISEVLGKGR